MSQGVAFLDQDWIREEGLCSGQACNEGLGELDVQFHPGPAGLPQAPSVWLKRAVNPWRYAQWWTIFECPRRMYPRDVWITNKIVPVSWNPQLNHCLIFVSPHRKKLTLHPFVLYQCYTQCIFYAFIKHISILNQHAYIIFNVYLIIFNVYTSCTISCTLHLAR